MRDFIDPDKRNQELNQKMIKASIMDTLGALLIGVGLFSKFAGSKQSLHPILSDPKIVNAAIVVGGVLLVLGMKRMFEVLREKHQLTKQDGS